MTECIFCKIIESEISSFKIYEDEQHLAFLDINPNTKGVTIVIPKEHVESTVINMQEDIYASTLVTAKKVAELLAKKLNVKKVGLAIEGMGVDHFHVKLYPFHMGTEMGEGGGTVYHEYYPGYLTTQLGPQADYARLEELSKELNA